MAQPKFDISLCENDGLERSSISSPLFIVDSIIMYTIVQFHQDFMYHIVVYLIDRITMYKFLLRRFDILTNHDITEIIHPQTQSETNMI